MTITVIGNIHHQEDIDYWNQLKTTVGGTDQEIFLGLLYAHREQPIDPCPHCGTTELLCGYPKECTSENKGEIVDASYYDTEKLTFTCTNCKERGYHMNLTGTSGKLLCEKCKEEKPCQDK